MTFHADLHVHSRHSRATSRDLDLEHMAWWAARKGITVVGTGDCVHPAWLAEIKEKLLPAGGGLFRLRPEIETTISRTLPPSCRHPVLFMLSTEISTIYKKGDRTRKVHHLIYAPDFDAVDRLAASLARIGNIASDGRPILGLDSRDLLEIALASGPDSYLVPAHIWTPWFSALGSLSGFDSIVECYRDLAHHIFAVETGLSSDPAMNWRISFLDRYRLTSSSDAHSPGKLGREATRFSCAPDYFAIRHALETGEGYAGTVEFFPEEGKYHLDGHRACSVRLTPKETISLDGRCPVCGGQVTVGVAHRVESLADRSEPDATPPATAGTVTSLVPLPEILSEIMDTGVASKAVQDVCDRVTATFGPELSLLDEVPIEDIARTQSLLGEAVGRLRQGAVIRRAGFDGEYGVIRLFEENERTRLTRGELLFEAPAHRRARPANRAVRAVAEPPAEPAPSASVAARGGSSVLAALDPDQRRAAEAVEGPVVVVAGPGSGKTRMLTHRLAHLVVELGVPAVACLVVTFTRRATEELRTRLKALLPTERGACTVHSFHSLGLAILRAHGTKFGLAPDFRVADEAERARALAAAMSIPQARAARLARTISVLKRSGAAPDQEVADAFRVLRQLGEAQGWIDFDDLVGMAVGILENDTSIAAQWRGFCRYISVDEFQDVDEQQYRMLRVLAGPYGNICVIGDPNQAIYGFRGADTSCFERFAQDFPLARSVRLRRNYRCTGTIASAAARVIGDASAANAVRPSQYPIVVHTAQTEEAEAAFVVETIEALLGGHDMVSAHRATSGSAPLGFADFAVLYRTDAQSAALRKAFDRVGIPFKKSSPAPIAEQRAVRAVLEVLERQDGEPCENALAARIAAGIEQVRQQHDTIDAATLAEAGRWLDAVAALPEVFGDETRLRELVALASEADFWDPRAERVSLLTMHAAKGLEFAVVFVVGMEDGLVPFSSEDGGAGGEERRLFYVAMTRARDRLYLSGATLRFWRGMLRTMPPSRFLRDIAGELRTISRPDIGGRRVHVRQLSLFA